MLPVLVLYIDQIYWEARICHNYFDMSQQELQEIISDKDFTLLADIEGLER